MGGPYAPRTPLLGHWPTTKVDDPICAVLIPFFLASAAINALIFIRNKKSGHAFQLSAPLIGFSMVRVVTLALRIAWAADWTNINVIVAASVFTNAGVMVLYIVNLQLTERILRAKHPKFGWSKPVELCFKFLLLCVIIMLFIVIPCTVYSFFTLDTQTLYTIRDIQRFAATFLAVLAFLPVPIITATLLVPSTEKLDKFGSGRWRTKVIMVLMTSSLLAFGAFFRVGISFATKTKYEWFHHKALFFCLNFVIELIVLYTYILMRFDRRFQVPATSDGPGSYSNSRATSINEDLEKNRPNSGSESDDTTILGRINTEEDFVGGTERPRS